MGKRQDKAHTDEPTVNELIEKLTTFIIEIYFRDDSASDKLEVTDWSDNGSYHVRVEHVTVEGNLVQVCHDEGVTDYPIDVIKKIDVYEPANGED